VLANCGGERRPSSLFNAFLATNGRALASPGGPSPALLAACLSFFGPAFFANISPAIAVSFASFSCWAARSASLELRVRNRFAVLRVVVGLGELGLLVFSEGWNSRCGINFQPGRGIQENRERRQKTDDCPIRSRWRVPGAERLNLCVAVEATVFPRVLGLRDQFMLRPGFPATSVCKAKNRRSTFFKRRGIDRKPVEASADMVRCESDSWPEVSE